MLDDVHTNYLYEPKENGTGPSVEFIKNLEKKR
jgi:hypothetical protein